MADGIPCIVFRREIEAACPELAKFLSQSGNQSHDVHSKETKVQLMLMMHQLFVTRKRFSEPTESTPPAGSAPTAESAQDAVSASWEQVVKEISVMKPHFADDAKECGDFAGRWSGGDEAVNLLALEAYAKILKVRR